MEAARLDALLVAVWPAAVRGEAWAWDRALRLVVTRMRLLGLTEKAPLVNIEVGTRAESPALQAARRTLPPLHDVIEGVRVSTPGVNGQ